jgi:small subunit ribosomal protein S16
MVRIRLARKGKKNEPIFRIVAIDQRRKNAGTALANLGFWHPAKNIKRIDKKGIEKWVSQGAQMSDAVRKLVK